MEINFKTYVLSLEKDTERREWMESVMKKTGLPYQFFKACTPAEITPEFRKYFEKADFYEWDINQDAVMATFLSHVMLLVECATSDKTLLIIEDDIDIVKDVDWTDLDFTQFDVLNLTGLEIACFAYMVTPSGANKILQLFDREDVSFTQAYDWELYKLRDVLSYKMTDEAVFVQVEDKFESNIAPKGYIKLQNI